MMGDGQMVDLQDVESGHDNEVLWFQSAFH